MTTNRHDHPITDRATNRLEVDLLPKPPDWTIDARCAQVGPDLFFPTTGDNSAPAKRICATCPVITECLEYAIAFEGGEAGQPTSYAAVGIYGGLSPQQRRRIIRGRRADAAGQGSAA